MFEKYRVKSNDTLEIIARKYNTNLSYLKDLNNIYYNESLREGMDIIVPKNKEKYFEEYKINKGDTIYAISKRYNINPSLLSALNGLNDNDYIYDGQTILLPVSGYSYYITKENDTLDSVSNMFKKSKDHIVKENENIYLMPGQIIVSQKK